MHGATALLAVAGQGSAVGAESQSVVQYDLAGAYLASSTTATLSATPTVGNLLVALTENANGAAVTLPSGFTTVGTYSGGGSGTITVAYREVQSGDGTAYTFSWSTTDYHLAEVIEVAGATSHTADQVSNNSDAQAPTLTDSNTGEVVFNAWTQDGGSGITPPGSPWTTIGNNSGWPYHQFVVCYALASTQSIAGGISTGVANGSLTTVAVSFK